MRFKQSNFIVHLQQLREISLAVLEHRGRNQMRLLPLQHLHQLHLLLQRPEQVHNLFLYLLIILYFRSIPLQRDGFQFLQLQGCHCLHQIIILHLLLHQALEDFGFLSVHH